MSQNWYTIVHAETLAELIDCWIQALRFHGD